MRIFGLGLGLQAIVWIVMVSTVICGPQHWVANLVVSFLAGLLASKIQIWANTYAWYMEHRRRLWRSYHIFNFLDEYANK